MGSVEGREDGLGRHRHRDATFRDIEQGQAGRRAEPVEQPDDQRAHVRYALVRALPMRDLSLLLPRIVAGVEGLLIGA